MRLLYRLWTFSKAQVSAFIGGATDYLLMIFFTEVFHIHYVLSIVIAGVIGAVVNFSLNKYWTFHLKNTTYKYSGFKQLLAFSQVAINSILLKVTGTYLITTFIGIDYRISRLITDFFVAILNYLLQKNWVFKKTI